jgi:hypothetical protein
MFKPKTWELWPVEDEVTAFFCVEPDAVRHLVPAPLELYEHDGVAQIAVGYIRFREGIVGMRRGMQNLPSTKWIPQSQETSWAIRVKKKNLIARFALFTMRLGSDRKEFLDDASNEGYEVHGSTFDFAYGNDRNSISCSDKGSPLFTLHRPLEGRIPVPGIALVSEVLIGKSQIFTKKPGGPLQYRMFRWRGGAYDQIAPRVACNLHDHPFYKGLDMTKVNPVPKQVFSPMLNPKKGVADAAYEHFWDQAVEFEG